VFHHSVPVSTTKPSLLSNISLLRHYSCHIKFSSILMSKIGVFSNIEGHGMKPKRKRWRINRVLLFCKITRAQLSLYEIPS
jgi:hypothetical protein